MTDTNQKPCCLLCGYTLDYEPGKRGRPPEFHPDCRKLWSILPYMEDLLLKINFTYEKENKVRGRLWGAANLANRNRANYDIQKKKAGKKVKE